MVGAATEATRSSLLSLPNQLTIARLVLSIVLFVLIQFAWFKTAFVVFVVAASTDWLDGFLARRWGMVSVFGRILDPLVDKIIICGAFIFLAAIKGSEIVPWMAVVVVGRELLVTALRAFLEQHGADFSATMSGKLKMVFQCVAAGGSLLLLSWQATQVPLSLPLFVKAAAWLAVLMTIYSGAEYVRTAAVLARDIPS